MREVRGARDVKDVRQVIGVGCVKGVRDVRVASGWRVTGCAHTEKERGDLGRQEWPVAAGTWPAA